MPERDIDGVHIELTVGDITRQPDVEAVVNAANAELMPGGGVAGAIHSVAGPELARECRPLAPLRPGECVRTSGQQLPTPWVLHCLGPVYGSDEPGEELLAACYRNVLHEADSNGLASVAFPALSTGAFGYPMAEAAKVALDTIVATAPSLNSVRLVRMVLTDRSALTTHETALANQPAD